MLKKFQHNHGIIQVVIGGDHSVVLSSVLADLDRGISPINLGIIHIDSHEDINLS